MRNQLTHRAAPVQAANSLPDELPDRRNNVRKFGPGQYPDYINNFCSVIERSLSLLQTQTGASCSVHFENPELNAILRRSCRIPEDYVYVALPEGTDYAIIPDSDALKGKGPVLADSSIHHDHGSIIIYPVRARRTHVGQIYLEFDGPRTSMEIQHVTCAMAADVISLAIENVDLSGQRALGRLELMNMTLSRLKEKDPDTFKHCERVSAWSGLLAQRMGLSDKEVKLVMDAGYLHDVGKSYVPQDILNKRGMLTREEYETVRKHSIYGYDMLSQFKSFTDLAPIVRAHHERWDGSGYPDGLAGEEIPLYARILSVIDAAEAIVSVRAYRPALQWPEAIKEISLCSGTQFDPRVVEAFKQMVKKNNFQLLSL